MSEFQCPLSGISCTDCGYREYSEIYNCFLAEFLDILRSLVDGDE